MGPRLLPPFPGTMEESADRGRANKKPLPTGTVAAALIGLLGILVGFNLEKALQRTEVSVASKNDAYIEMIQAGDAVLTSAFVVWDINATAGSDEVLKKRLFEILIIPEDLIVQQNALRDAANRLRMVVDEEDAHLINVFVSSLRAERPSPADEQVQWETADRQLAGYSDAKLALVNEFRTDVLGEGSLPAEEAQRMLTLDQEIVGKSQSLVKSFKEIRDSDPNAFENDD